MVLGLACRRCVLMAMDYALHPNRAHALLTRHMHTHAQVEESGYVLPRTCPFSKEVDMYLDNENHKKEARFSNWRYAFSP